MAEWKVPFDGVKRAFWTHVILCLAGALVVFLPDRGDPYTNAIQELGRLGSVKITENGVAAALRRHIDKDYGKNLRDTLRLTAKKGGLTFAPDALRDGLRYLSIQSGLRSINFDTEVPDLLALADRVTSQQPYEVAVPDLSQLRTELTTKFASLDEGFNRILTIDFDCSSDGESCSGQIQIDDSIPGVPFSIVELSPLRTLLGPLPVTELDVIHEVDRSIDKDFLALSGIRLVSTEIFDKTRVEAIAELERLKYKSRQPLTVFGVTLPGSIAPIVAPPLLAAAGIFLLVSLQSLRRLKPPYEEIRMAFVAPLFEGQGGAVIRASTLILFPLFVDIGLLIDATGAGWNIAIWVGALSLVHVACTLMSWRLSRVMLQ